MELRNEGRKNPKQNNGRKGAAPLKRVDGAFGLKKKEAPAPKKKRAGRGENGRPKILHFCFIFVDIFGGF